MDNAAKGLIVAGGILLAIMTLTIFMYGLTTTSRINLAQDEADAMQELTNFNLQYESYNKKRMYGVDVITVINKAVQNNKNMNTETNAAGRHYVDVVVSIPQPKPGHIAEENQFKNELEVLTFNRTTGINSREYYVDNAVSELPADPSFSEMRTLLQRNAVIGIGEHHLLYLHNGKAEIMKDFKEKFIDTDAKDMQQKYIDNTKNEEKTYILHSALTNFKKAIFTCKDVVYNNEGRVERIVFELSNNNR